MKNFIAIIFISIFLISCSKEDATTAVIPKNETVENKVLMLKVDYNTNTFEGGKEFTFAQNPVTFTANVAVQSNEADGGNIKVFYQELNEKLFEGSQSFSGQVVFPEVWEPASSFASALTADYFLPPTVQNIYNPTNETLNFESAWIAIQSKLKVRNYLLSNPGQIAKIFLFTEYSFGIVPPRKKWIIILKN